MTKVWALQGIDGEIHAICAHREPLDKHIVEDPFGFGTSVVEIDYDDSPITSRGEELQLKIREKLVGVKNIHINKQAGFYAMSIDDRLQFLYDVFTQIEDAPSFSFNDSHRAPESKQPATDLDKDLPVAKITEFDK